MNALYFQGFAGIAKVKSGKLSAKTLARDGVATVLCLSLFAAFDRSEPPIHENASISPAIGGLFRQACG
jgi:hypothetical protein